MIYVYYTTKLPRKVQHENPLPAKCIRGGLSYLRKKGRTLANYLEVPEQAAASGGGGGGGGGEHGSSRTICCIWFKKVSGTRY